MNERIKLLKHQASVWCDENISEQFSEETNGYGSAWEEKFAELIVGNCILTIQMGITRDGPDTEKYLRSMKHIKQIKEHFGVEE